MLSGTSAPYGSASPQAWPSFFGGGSSGKGKGDPKKGVFMEVGGVPDFYYETEPGKYALVPEDTRRQNPTLFGPQKLDYLRARLDRSRERETTAGINRNAAQRWEREFGAQRQDAAERNALAREGLALQGQQNANSYQLGVLGIEAGERSSQRQFQHLGSVLLEHANARKQERELRLAELKNSTDQQVRLLAYKTESESEDRALTRKQIEDNAQLARERMTIEKDQFDRQLAQDERAGRRARVINSLSIAAQSLARL